MRHAPVLALVCSWPAAAPADPPALDIPAEIRPAGQYCILIPKTDAVGVTYVGLDRVDPLPSVLLKDPRQFVLDSRGLAPGRYRFAAVAAGATGEQTRADFAVVVGDPPPVPPGPTPPGPVPPDPKPPAPISSFRVIFVVESGATLPAGQVSAYSAAAVQSYLSAKTTRDGVWAGWRKYDPDQDASKDTPALAALWAAVKPKLTTTPAIAVEVNGKVDIVPLPNSAAECLTLLKKYGGE